MIKANLILGAGFSHAAGFPLTKDLFKEIPNSPFISSQDIFKNVKEAWENWCQDKVENGKVELWLKELYQLKDNELAQFKNGVLWVDVLDFIMARLVDIPYGKTSHYYHGITNSVKSEVHRKFWEMIRKKLNVKYIITTNYDILIEQGLKHEYSDKHRFPPMCFYGGYPYIQIVKKMTNVTKKEYKEIHLGHEIELLKLHGSLNWVDEPHGYKIHEDVRAVFRKTRKLGKPRIIPPLEEKEQPQWAYNIWKRAKETLIESDLWFICGFSLNDYDKALYNFFKDIGRKINQVNVVISSPSSEQLVNKWKKILPSNTIYHLLPGIPDVLDEKYWNFL